MGTPFTLALAGISIAGLTMLASVPADGPSLYNGIRLPSDWPPKSPSWTREPVIPPYLYAPPAVIPIDVGRQLFVDDFLIEHTDMERVHHRPTIYPDNPVLKPDREWEKKGRGETAMPFSDGVWFDPTDGLFKLWYMGGYTEATCLAWSRDGTHWEKPDFKIVPGTNIVLQEKRDSSSVVLDHEEKDPGRRWKMFYTHGEESPLFLRFSHDGIRWGPVVTQSEGGLGGRHTVFWNPFLRVWVFSLRDTWASQPGARLPVSRTIRYIDQIGGSVPVGRTRRYFEHADVVAGASFRVEQTVRWFSSDRLDPQPGQHPEEPASQIYNHDAIAYESLVLGLFSIWQGGGQPSRYRRPKRNEVLIGYSRDGFYWHRPDRTPFLPVSEDPDSWRNGNVQSAGGVCLIVGDRLLFYFSGRKSLPEVNPTPKGEEAAATGLAMLRRDGFVSMRAGSRWEGSLTTRPLLFHGRHLFVNVSAASGVFRAQVADCDGRTLARSRPLSVDSTIAKVQWDDLKDLSVHAGKPVRFRFFLKQGDLYSFWVSRDESGASSGYVAAGGPGFPGNVDTVGKGAYEAAATIGRAWE
ncbi:MAG: glycosyl hydrolase family 32 [Acidobacteria bacterium]|nr:glycosyl hydrolase family 32 [Acidobacteriota bacterium]